MIDDDIKPLKPYCSPLRNAQFVPVGPHPGAFGVIRKHDRHTGVDLYVSRPEIVRPIEDGRVVGIIEFTGEAATPTSPWWNRTQAVLVEGRSGVILYGELSTHWIEASFEAYRRGVNAWNRYTYYLPYFADDLSFPTVPELNEVAKGKRLEAAGWYHYRLEANNPNLSRPDALMTYESRPLAMGDEVQAGKTALGCITPVLKKVKPSTISRHMLHIELLSHGHRSDAGLWEHGQPQPEHCFDPTPLLLQASHSYL